MPKRFDQARPFLTLGLVVAAWLIIPTVLKIFIRASFLQFTNPVAFHHRDTSRLNRLPAVESAFHKPLPSIQRPLPVILR